MYNIILCLRFHFPYEIEPVFRLSSHHCEHFNGIQNGRQETKIYFLITNRSIEGGINEDIGTRLGGQLPRLQFVALV